MKYSTKYIGVLLAAGLLTISCDDQLDLKPISEETVDNAYVTGNQIEAALIGVYESFQSSDYYVWDQVLYSDVRSDNHYAGGDNPEIFQIDAINIQSNNGRVNKAWASIYNAIMKANLVLEKTPGIELEITEERRAQIIGEAHFLRAYHYFNLVKLYGGVPLVLETIKSADPAEVRVPRNSVDEVYAQIIADLEAAAAALPDVYLENGQPSLGISKARATRGAANAILAKVYAQKPVPDYNRVIEYANLVINSPAGYTLLPDYTQLFDGSHYNNTESIIEMQFIGGNEGTWGPQMQLPPSVSGDNWRKFVTPSHNLVNAYDSEGDAVRKNCNILFENITFWADEYWNNSIGSSIPFAYKWKNAGGWNSADHVYLIRLADIILLRAEAYNATGQIGLAATDVNQIRNRATLGDLPAAASASQSAMRTAILKERRLELAQEAHRWDDLVRNNVVVETMNNANETNLATGQQVNYNMQEFKILLPIPLEEINRNPTLIQNPGYN